MISLRNVIKANAASCIIFGLLFIITPSKTALFLSEDNPAPILLISLLGIGLMANGLHLIWVSMKPIHNKLVILYFSSNDFIWVVASIALIIGKIWITTTPGIITTLLVAAMVGIFGALQVSQLKTLPHNK